MRACSPAYVSFAQINFYIKILKNKKITWHKETGKCNPYSVEIKYEMPQMLELAGKDFKAAIIYMSKILMGKRFKKLKENMIWMSKQIGNVNREKEPRRNSWTEKQNNEIKEV